MTMAGTNPNNPAMLEAMQQIQQAIQSSAAIYSEATGKVSDMAKDIATQNIDFFKQSSAQAQALLQPFQAAGQSSVGTLQGLLGINGAAAQTKAMQTTMGTAASMGMQLNNQVMTSIFGSGPSYSYQAPVQSQQPRNDYSSLQQQLQAKADPLQSQYNQLGSQLRDYNDQLYSLQQKQSPYQDAVTKANKALQDGPEQYQIKRAQQLQDQLNPLYQQQKDLAQTNTLGITQAQRVDLNNNGINSTDPVVKQRAEAMQQMQQQISNLESARNSYNNGTNSGVTDYTSHLQQQLEQAQQGTATPYQQQIQDLQNKINPLQSQYNTNYNQLQAVAKAQQGLNTTSPNGNNTGPLTADPQMLAYTNSILGNGLSGITDQTSAQSLYDQAGKQAQAQQQAQVQAQQLQGQYNQQGQNLASMMNGGLQGQYQQGLQGGSPAQQGVQAGGQNISLPGGGTIQYNQGTQSPVIGYLNQLTGGQGQQSINNSTQNPTNYMNNTLSSLNNQNNGAIANFLNNGAVQSSMNAMTKYGSQAIQNSAASKGMLNSGNTMANLYDYGQSLAGQYLVPQIGNITNQVLGSGTSLANAGLGANASLANQYLGAGASLAGGLATAQMGANTALSTSAMGNQSQGLNSLLNTGLSGAQTQAGVYGQLGQSVGNENSQMGQTQSNAILSNAQNQSNALMSGAQLQFQMAQMGLLNHSSANTDPNVGSGIMAGGIAGTMGLAALFGL